MLQCDQHITTYVNYDPTRTTSLRNKFARDMDKRFNELIRVIRNAIVDQDCFGLRGITTQQMNEPGYRAFAFPRSRDKIEAFMRWLKEQVERGVLTVAQIRQIGEAMEKEWTDIYIYDSYKRGVMRARTEMLAIGMAVPSIEASGGIASVLSAPFHIDRVGAIYTRTFSGLTGITSAMENLISQVLAQGIIDGDNPLVIARKLRAVIDGTGMGTLGVTDTTGRFIPAKRRAEMLARTEIIRAFHLAAIAEYRNWGVLGIKVKAEWRTAKDAKVCPECGSMEGQRFTLDEIEPMIPLHPFCRCFALPVMI